MIAESTGLMAAANGFYFSIYKIILKTVTTTAQSKTVNGDGDACCEHTGCSRTYLTDQNVRSRSKCWDYSGTPRTHVMHIITIIITILLLHDSHGPHINRVWLFVQPQHPIVLQTLRECIVWSRDDVDGCGRLECHQIHICTPNNGQCYKVCISMQQHPIGRHPSAAASVHVSDDKQQQHECMLTVTWMAMAPYLLIHHHLLIGMINITRRKLRSSSPLNLCARLDVMLRNVLP